MGRDGKRLGKQMMDLEIKVTDLEDSKNNMERYKTRFVKYTKA